MGRRPPLQTNTQFSLVLFQSQISYLNSQTLERPSKQLILLLLQASWRSPGWNNYLHHIQSLCKGLAFTLSPLRDGSLRSRHGRHSHVSSASAARQIARDMPH